MRLVFVGTPQASVPTLRRLIDDGHDVVAVWTQPDRPSGRGNKTTYSPVKEFALEHKLTIYQPSRLKPDDVKALFASHNADAAIVVAYGRILPEDYLRAPKHGCINVHFSLLPHYRGAAPVNWAIVNGESKSGVTTMFMEPSLDTGPILMQEKTAIGAQETAPELMSRLSESGAVLLSETLRRLPTLTPRPQHHADATFAPILNKEDGIIDWQRTAFEIDCAVRGFQPWPNAQTTFNSKGLTLWLTEVSPMQIPGAHPGEVMAAHGGDLIVRCGGETAIRILELQPEAKRRMSSRDFLNGTHVKAGDRFGQ